MIQGQDFLYYLHSEDYRFYATNEYGHFYETTSPVALDFSPAGWDAISIQWQRSIETWGISRTFTVPLDFVEDGALILKQIVYSTGTEAKIFMTVAKQHLVIEDLTYAFIYKPLYKGEPDLSTISHEGPKATVNFIEGGLAKMIAANKDTVYEFPVEEVEVQHTGLNLHNTSKYVTIPEQLVAQNPAFTFALQWLSVNFINNDGTVFDTNQQTTTVGTKYLTNAIHDDNRFPDNWFFSTDAPISLSFNYIWKGSLNSGLQAELYIKSSNGSRRSLATITGSGNPAGEVLPFEVSINQAITLEPGEKLYLIAQVTDAPIPSGGAVLVIEESTIDIAYTSVFKTTLVKYITAYSLFKQLIAKITDNKYTAESILLANSLGWVLTSGDALRGLAGAKIKTSLSTFFKWCDAEFCSGMGIIDDQLRIELRTFWFDGPVTDLGEVSALKISPAADLYFNTIKIGYENQTYDNVNGKDEFNTTAQWTTPRSLAKSYDQISPYRFDMYGIEFTRINLEGKTTTDSSTDNDVFGAVTIVQDGIRPLDRQLNAGTTGILDAASAFNIPASPKRMLERHGWYIHSVMDKLDAGNLTFQTTDKNAEMIVNGVAEKADVNIGMLPAKKFLPWYFEFTTQTPDDYEVLLEGTALRKYSFTYQGVTGLGIAIKSGVSPSDNKTQVFQLLADASVDMLKFREINE